jgi:uncharacterized protein (DUF2384 family)
MEIRTAFATRYAKQSVDWMKESLELTNREIGMVLGTSSRTVIRWSNQASCPTPVHREHLEDIAVLRQLLSDSFQSKEAMHAWLGSPIPALKGRTPLSAILCGDLDAVIGLLGTLLAGAFV